MIFTTWTKRVAQLHSNQGGVVAPTGKKRIGSVTSAECEELVTVLCTVGASGVVLPPMFVFSRDNFQNNFIVGGPLGCIGGS